jgi:hypothetical protein
MIHKITQWIVEQTKRYPIEAIAVVHSNGNPVDKFPFRTGTPAEEFAAELYKAMEEDAEAFGSDQLYFLLFYRDASSALHECRKPVRVAGPPSTDIQASEAPNEVGLVAQAMRHQEINVKTVENLLVTFMKKTDDQLDRQYRRNNELSIQNMEMATSMRSMLLDQSELELKKKQAESEAMIYQKLLEMGEVFAPLMLSYIMKPKPGTPEEEARLKELEDNAPPEMRVIGAFLGTLEPDQYDRLGTILNIAQRGALEALQKGDILAELIPATVARVMNGLTQEQVGDIYDVLRTPEQAAAFKAVHGMRKLSLEWQKNAALDAAKAPLPETPSLSSDG